MPVLNETRGTPVQVPGKLIARRQLPRLPESRARLAGLPGPEESAGE
jgi:hypothetical protein